MESKEGWRQGRDQMQRMASTPSGFGNERRLDCDYIAHLDILAYENR